MRDDVERVLRDVPLRTLALAIGAGTALIDLGTGVTGFVDGVLTHGGDPGFFQFSRPLPGGLSWHVGGRVLTFDGLLRGAVELAVVIGAAIFIHRHAEPDT